MVCLIYNVKSELISCAGLDDMGGHRCQNDREKSPNKFYEVNFFRKCIKILSKIHKRGAHLKNF